MKVNNHYRKLLPFLEVSTQLRQARFLVIVSKGRHNVINHWKSKLCVSASLRENSLLGTPSFFVILALVIAMVGSVSAQTFNASIVTGVNLSQLDGDKLSGFNKLGLNTGLRVSANLNERWSMSTEFLYSEQGASLVPSDDFIAVYDKIKLKYVEVPLMINFSDWKILASTGISYNRLASYEVIDRSGTDISEFENYNENIFAIVFGATIFVSEKVGVNIRWSKYLNNLRVTTDTDNTRFIGRNIGLRMYYKL